MIKEKKKGEYVHIDDVFWVLDKLQKKNNLNKIAVEQIKNCIYTDLIDIDGGYEAK